LNGRNPQYELIEPVTRPSIHADWLDEHGEGFHHVGYVVQSLERTTAEMEAAGHPAIARIHSFGVAGTARQPTTTRPGARVPGGGSRAAVGDAADGVHDLGGGFVVGTRLRRPKEDTRHDLGEVRPPSQR